MSTVHRTTTAEKLLAAVQRLPADELREFTQRFQAWKGRRASAASEAELIATVEEFSQLPSAKQRRYESLRVRCEAERLTPSELDEYQLLLKELEARNVQRVEALAALAAQRGMTLSALMTELRQGDNEHD
jgi:hypothetical protein